MKPFGLPFRFGSSHTANLFDESNGQCPMEIIQYQYYISGKPLASDLRNLKILYFSQ
jgi:hypothetical protein